MEGWIKLHRKLSEHWIWKDPVKLKWWVDILFTVNHDDNKVNIGFELFDCKRGQSIMSLQNWAIKWNVNKDTVRNFFMLLAKDGMILHENMTKTTRITVCNYDTYQTSLHDEQTQSKRKANAKQTQSDANKNDKNDKEEYIKLAKANLFNQIKEIFPDPSESIKSELNKFYAYWTEQNKSGTKVKYQLEKTWDIKRRLSTWLDNASKFNPKKNEPQRPANY